MNHEGHEVQTMTQSSKNYRPLIKVSDLPEHEREQFQLWLADRKKEIIEIDGEFYAYPFAYNVWRYENYYERNAQKVDRSNGR